MNESDAKIPWYAAGLAFECQVCGRCCAGPEEGYVWLNEAEIRALAEFLRLEEAEFRARYIRRLGRRWSLVEKKKGRDCIFLEEGRCRVYPVRPEQCRTWPFWPANLASPEDWSHAARRCRGINRGTLFSLEEIQARAGRSRD